MNPKDQFKPSDVTFWGIAALVFGAGALLFANLGALLPSSTLVAIHSPRLDGGNLNLLRTQVSELREDAVRMRNENNRLLTMFALAEQDQGKVARRVGAIESTLPILLEGNGPNIDQSIVTAAIGEEPVITQADGGSVAVVTRPLDGDASAPVSVEMNETMPAELPSIPLISGGEQIDGGPNTFGVALGPKVTVRDAFVAWKDITNKAGPLLLGLGPLLSGNAGVENQRLVAGPIDDYTRAEQVCVRMIRIGISCLPVPYAGQSLPQ